MTMPDLTVDHFNPHELTDLEVAMYLHAQGIVNDPNSDQNVVTDLPAVFVGELPDQPDRAISIAVIVDDRDEDDANPAFTILIVCRGVPNDLWSLRELGGDVFTAMHDRTHFNLTANQRVLTSRRISKGREVLDQNRRWQRADVYRLRVAVPTTTQ